MRLSLESSARWLALAYLSTVWILSAQPVSTTRVYSDPAGAAFYVDGQKFVGPATFLWPAGSKHTLSILPVQDATTIKIRYRFNGWSDSTGILTTINTSVVVTADPGITYYKASITIQYAVTLSFFSCTAADPRTCPNWPGEIQVNQTAYLVDTDVYINAGSPVALVAEPASGFIFAGWRQGLAGGTQAYLASFILNNPVIVFPVFARARSITMLTSPPGLQILADRTTLTTPATLEWGVGTQHTLGVVTPQIDSHGQTMAFESWSDGGASTHNYEMSSETGPAVTITATFAPAGRVTFLTDPPGLKLLVDGRDNWPAYSFSWAVGTTHTVSAPATQTDFGGRMFAFKSWSNGGAASQTIGVSPAQLPAGLRFTATYQAAGTIAIDASLQSVTLQVDGSDCATPCNIQRPAGTTVQVTAPPSVNVNTDTHLTFSGWLDSGPATRTLTVTAAPQSLRVNYAYSYRLAMSADPLQSVSWQTTPAASDGFFPTGTQVQVMAVAQPGFKFRAWGGDAAGYFRPAWLTMAAPHHIAAVCDPDPFVAPGGVQNEAGVTPQPDVAPGSIVSIYGASLAPTVAVGPDSPLVTDLSGVTVSSGGRTFPLLFVSPGQINLQLPSDMSPGHQTLHVSWRGLDTDAGFTVARNAPGLFYNLRDDQPLALATHEDGSPVTTDHPAHRGETITLLGTGFGPSKASLIDGQAAPPDHALMDAVQLVTGTRTLSPDWAGAAAGRVGVTAIRLHIPADLPHSSTLEIKARANGVDSNTVLLSFE